MTDVPDTPRPSAGRVVVSVVAIAAIALLALVTVGIIWLTEPEAQREGAVRRTPMLVEVTRAERGTYRPVLVALGTVVADQDVRLEPRVSGQVVRLDPAFEPGRVVDAGDALVVIDPADARNALAQQRSAVQAAEADLALERGRQAVARAERDRIREPLTPDQEALILRTPQLQAAEAAVDAARAAARQAELALARTTVTAPFRALVLTRATSVGAQVGPGVGLGRLVGVDRFLVELTLPTGQLRHLELPHDGVAGGVVRIRDRAAWPEDTWRDGHVDAVVRQVDDQTRLARLRVAIDDPLALQTDGPALLAGAWVEARLEGAALQGVVRLPRGLLRKDDTVWVMDDGALRIRPVDVIVEDADHAYLAAGLDPDELVVTTDLSTVTDGAPLRTEAAE